MTEKNSVRKKITKVILLIMISTIVLYFIIMIFFIFNGMSSCSNENMVKTYGDFLYEKGFLDESGRWVVEKAGIEVGINIRGLSENGKTKEVVVVPEYIEGIKVKEIGYPLWLGVDGKWESEVLKKVFIPFSVSIVEDILKPCSNLEKVILLSHKEINKYYSNYYYDASNFNYCFTTSYNYIVGDELNICYSGVGDYYFGNVSYWYNYKNSPNDGYYWVDDYNYGEKITYIPEEPKREGYEFIGWYKEPECINKWRFETDKLPEKLYATVTPPTKLTDPHHNMEVYQETKLYAKWIKN